MMLASNAAERDLDLGYSETMEFGVLGPIRVAKDGDEKVLAGDLQRTLLAVLLSRANTVVSNSLLTDALWPAPGRRAEANLHLSVHRLRRKISAPARLVSEPGGYRLVVLPGELDAERFESLIQEGAELLPVDPGQAAERFRAAQRLCRGAPYDGVDTEALIGDIERLGERRLLGLEKLYAAELATGRHAELVPELTEAVAAHPLNERLHAFLMVALYRSGRQGQALAAYQSARCLLVDELGQEPGPELRDLEYRILAGESTDLDPARDIAPVPAQLPGDVRGFTGRSDQLAALDTLLEEPVATAVSSSVAVIVGTGGVGKTALALRWAHRVCGQFADGQLYVDMHGFGPDPTVSAQEALGGFLRELGLDSTRVPTGEDERAARFRTLVSRRRMLIVVDNAVSVEQVRPLLPGESTCVVLITSRDSLAGLVAREGARRVLLDRLPQRDALALLGNLVGPRAEAEPDATVELVQRCARLPLAIRIAAELVNTSPSLRIEDLAAELTDQRAALDLLDAGGDESTAVRTVFSWSYQRLAPDTARGFRLLGLHPGYDIALEAAAALFGADVVTTRATLRALLRAHHLDQSGSRFHMHDLLRAYAIDLGKAVDQADEREAAFDRLVDYYVQQTENSPASAWLDKERSNLAMVAAGAARSSRLSAPTRIAAATRGYLKSHGHHDEALPIYEAALAAATQRGDYLAQGTACRNLGSTYRWMGRLREAYDFMHRALDCYQQAGSAQHTAMQLNNLGVTCTWLGRYDEAIDLLEGARDLGRTLGGPGRTVTIGALAYLGQAYLYRGEPERALAHESEVLEALEDPDQLLWAEVTSVAGMACERLGRYDEARGHLEAAWRLSQAAGLPVMLMYLTALGTVYWRLGRHHDAFEYAHRCLALTQRTNERTFEPDARLALGELHRLDGAYAEAHDQYRAALTLATAIGLPYQRAYAEIGIGDALDELGDPAAAEQHWRTAHQIWCDIGSADARLALDRFAP